MNGKTASFRRSWKKILEVTAPTNTNIDQTVNVSYPSNCEELLFSIQRSDDRTAGTRVVPFKQFANGGAYVDGIYRIYSGALKEAPSELVNMVFIWVSNTSIEVSANGISEEMKFRVYAR